MKTTLTAATSSAVRVLIAAGFITLLSTLQAAPTVSNLSWLAGVWDGIGDDGTTKGDARTVWTEPVEGVMSWTFRWHQDDHVHFAFSVVEDTGDEVLLRDSQKRGHSWRVSSVWNTVGPQVSSSQCRRTGSWKNPGAQLQRPIRDSLFATGGEISIEVSMWAKKGRQPGNLLCRAGLEPEPD
jgi:hypothetical protein